MASRLILKNQLLTRQVRSYASKATETFPEESFSGKAWRNGLIAIVAGAIWYRADQHITHSGDDKHPFTRWIEYHMNQSGENDRVNQANLDSASAAAEYRLFYQEAERAPIHRMRYPESFERASARALTTGVNCELSDVKIRSD
ncbi:hypothetical protein K501DRAFT_260325 [Backusella circina FSU 941]|nr:hypothetical protein K501DRAFT_260325 [Backusella circina FSU 941]